MPRFFDNENYSLNGNESQQFNRQATRFVLYVLVGIFCLYIITSPFRSSSTTGTSQHSKLHDEIDSSTQIPKTQQPTTSPSDSSNSHSTTPSESSIDFDSLMKIDLNTMSSSQKTQIHEFLQKVQSSGQFSTPSSTTSSDSTSKSSNQQPNSIPQQDVHSNEKHNSNQNSQKNDEKTPQNSKNSKNSQTPKTSPNEKHSKNSSSSPSSSQSQSQSIPTIPPLFEGHEIIVTLTTIPDRMKYLNSTLLSLVTQTVPPTEIVLNIPYLSRRFQNPDGTPLVYDLPLEFIRYIHALGAIDPTDPTTFLNKKNFDESTLSSSTSSTPHPSDDLNHSNTSNNHHNNSHNNNNNNENNNKNQHPNSNNNNNNGYINLSNLNFEPISFPYSFHNLSRIPKITIHRCDDDGPATKLLPTLAREFSIGRLDSILMIADDDMVYPPNWVESMVGYYLSRPELRYSAIGARGYCAPPSNIWEWRVISQIAVSAQQLYNITKLLNEPFGSLIDENGNLPFRIEPNSSSPSSYPQKTQQFNDFDDLDENFDYFQEENSSNEENHDGIDEKSSLNFQTNPQLHFSTLPNGKTQRKMYLGSTHEEDHRTLLSPNAYKYVFRQHNFTSVLQTGGEHIYQDPPNFGARYSSENERNEENSEQDDDKDGDKIGNKTGSLKKGPNDWTEEEKSILKQAKEKWFQKYSSNHSNFSSGKKIDKKKIENFFDENKSEKIFDEQKFIKKLRLGRSWQEDDNLETKVILNQNWAFAYLFDENHPSYIKNEFHKHSTSDLIGTLDDIHAFLHNTLEYNVYKPIDTHIESILPYTKHQQRYMSHTPVDIITGNNGFLMRPYYFLRYSPFIGNITRVFVERYELTSHQKFQTRRENFMYTTSPNQWLNYRNFYKSEFQRVSKLLVDENGINRDVSDKNQQEKAIFEKQVGNLSEYAQHLVYVLQEGDKIYSTRQEAAKKAFEDALADEKYKAEQNKKHKSSNPDEIFFVERKQKSEEQKQWNKDGTRRGGITENRRGGTINNDKKGECNHPELDESKMSAFDYHIAHLNLHKKNDQIEFESTKHDDILYQYSQDQLMQNQEFSSHLTNIIEFGNFGPLNRDEYIQNVSNRIDDEIRKDPSGRLMGKQPDLFDFSQNTRNLGVLGSNGKDLPDSVYYMDDIWFNGILAANNVSRAVISMTTDPIHRPKMQSSTTTLEQVPVGRSFHNNVLLKAFEQYWTNCPYIATNITIPQFYLRYYALSGQTIEEQRDEALKAGKRNEQKQQKNDENNKNEEKNQEDNKNNNEKSDKNEEIDENSSNNNHDDYRNQWTNPWQGWGVKDNETNVSTQYYYSPFDSKKNSRKKSKKTNSKKGKNKKNGKIDEDDDDGIYRVPLKKGGFGGNRKPGDGLTKHLDEKNEKNQKNNEKNQKHQNNSDPTQRATHSNHYSGAMPVNQYADVVPRTNNDNNHNNNNKNNNKNNNQNEEKTETKNSPADETTKTQKEEKIETVNAGNIDNYFQQLINKQKEQFKEIENENGKKNDKNEKNEHSDEKSVKNKTKSRHDDV